MKQKRSLSSVKVAVYWQVLRVEKKKKRKKEKRREERKKINHKIKVIAPIFGDVVLLTDFQGEAWVVFILS